MRRASPPSSRLPRRRRTRQGSSDLSAGGVTAEPPVVAAPPPTADVGRLGRYLTAAVFLAPALFMLGVWMVYPAVYTIVRSFFGQHGFVGTWVGVDNYKHIWTDHGLRT